MDSARSSSLQPSGGGDDEFGSPAAPLSAFFRSITATSAAATLQPLPYYSGDHHFDSLYDLDSTRPSTGFPSTETFSTSPPSAAVSVSHGSGVGASPVPQLADQSNVAAATTAQDRSSKKRCRASRCAPTTVLTTDASNFRAMVQELTGIQSFAASPSPCAGARLGHSAAAFRSYSDPPLPASSFLLPRPFMQKVQPPSFLPISSTSPAHVSTAVTAISSISDATTSSDGHRSSGSNSYQLRSSSHILLQREVHMKDQLQGEDTMEEIKKRCG